MLCPNCHTDNAEGSKFCETCGTPLTATEANTAASSASMTPQDAPVAPTPAGATPAPAAASVPGPGGAAVPPIPMPQGAAGMSAPAVVSAPAATQPTATVATATQTAPATATTTAATKPGPNKLIIMLVAVLAALIIAGVALFLTYRSEVWGGKSLPDPASIASSVTDKNGKKASAVKAKDVTAALKAKGLNAKTEKVFSGKDSGEFIGYKNAAPGARVKAGSTVVVQESAGPGVPKDTLGAQVNKVTETFADMGVPVHYKKVFVSDAKKNPEGSVVATYPAAGTGVKDDEKDKGIYIGVAAKGDDTALPIDVMGQDVDTVKSQLESEGHTVTVEQRFSSKDYVGKVSGASPAPGSSLSSGEDVTLYQGIDASDTKEAFTGHDLAETGGDALLGTTRAADGQWCTNDGKCITIDNYKVTEGGSDNADYTGDYDGTLIACDAIQQPYCNSPKADYLVTQDYGAFELMPHISLTNFWANGKMYDGNGVHMGDSWPTSGEYHMQDLFLVVPTGSDLQGLEDKGYFDKDALAAAKKQKAVDTNRPFILYRDPKLYDTTTAPYNGAGNGANPFLPYNGYNGSKSDIVKMKPAPSDADAYYLVEASEPDWDSLPDADVKAPSTKDKGNSKDSKDSKDSNKSSKKSGTPDAASLKVFSDSAGAQYAYTIAGDGSAFTTISLDDRGNFSGTVDEADMSSGDSAANAPRIQTKFSGKFASATSNSDGTVTLKCDASAFKIDDKSKSDKSGFSPCGTFTGYPSGTSSDALPSEAQAMLVKRGTPDGPSDWMLINTEGSGVFIRTQK